MLKLFYENPEFDSYTQFDPNTGILSSISKIKFETFLPDQAYLQERAHNKSYIKNDVQIFYGEPLPNSTRFPRRIYFQITR